RRASLPRSPPAGSEPDASSATAGRRVCCAVSDQVAAPGQLASERVSAVSSGGGPTYSLTLPTVSRSFDDLKGPHSPPAGRFLAIRLPASSYCLPPGVHLLERAGVVARPWTGDNRRVQPELPTGTV